MICRRLAAHDLPQRGSMLHESDPNFGCAQTSLRCYENVRSDAWALTDKENVLSLSVAVLAASSVWSVVELWLVAFVEADQPQNIEPVSTCSNQVSAQEIRILKILD